MAAHTASRLEVSIEGHVVAAQQAAERWHEGTLALDCAVSAALRSDGACDFRGLNVSDGLVEVLDLEEAPASNNLT
jgi:hypothetical protein